jgi:AbiV family abortive infection protein
MVKKNRNYKLDLKILYEYQILALDNAEDLVLSSKSLFEKQFYARAYFLACSSIEETGKAYLAFTSKGRNLQSIEPKLKNTFETHTNKITMAFMCWMLESSNKEEAAKTCVDLSVHLHNGREKSMYVDINEDNSLSIPTKLVGERQSADSIYIAEQCLRATREYVANNTPQKTSSFDDKFFNMNTKKITELFSEKDFGDYLLHCLENENNGLNFSKYITTYHDAYYRKGRKFKK